MNNSIPKLTIGLVLGDRYSHVVALDAGGECLEDGRLRTTPEALQQRFGALTEARVVMEAGTHSPWISRLLASLGHEVIVANPRQLRLIHDNDSKSDRADAEYLARIGRMDPKLLRGIEHRGEQAQADLALVRSYDRRIEELAQTSYPEAACLQQVTGVGPVTSLTCILVIEDPTRFRRSRSVGAYLGLRPRQRESGDSAPQLRITKAAHPLLRRLLVQSACYILGPHGPDCDLRRFGEQLAARGGMNANKRARVAVARKLAVLLHRLWITGKVCEPLRNLQQEDDQAA